MPSPKRTPSVKKEAKPKPNMIRFRVVGDITMLSHLSNVFTVKNGKVDLPAGENWYADMVGAGILEKE